MALGEVVAVLCQPDKPKGRGQELAAPPVKTAALGAGLRLLQPTKLKGTDVAEQLRALTPDVCVVTAYGKILPQDVLDAARHGCVNVHASLLPRWRGAAPIQWALAEGDAETGVTLMRLDAGLDTGPTFARVTTPIAQSDTAATLHARLAQMGAALLREALPDYLAGRRTPMPQPVDGVTHAPPLKKEEGRLDFARPAAVLERRIRAFTPWPGAFTHWRGQRLKVLEATVVEGSGEPGTLCGASAAGLDVVCAEGALRLVRLQLEGKRAMSASEFLAGRPASVGDRPFV